MKKHFRIFARPERILVGDKTDMCPRDLAAFRGWPAYKAVSENAAPNAGLHNKKMDPEMDAFLDSLARFTPGRWSYVARLMATCFVVDL